MHSEQEIYSELRGLWLYAELYYSMSTIIPSFWRPNAINGSTGFHTTASNANRAEGDGRDHSHCTQAWCSMPT